MRRCEARQDRGDLMVASVHEHAINWWLQGTDKWGTQHRVVPGKVPLPTHSESPGYKQFSTYGPKCLLIQRDPELIFCLWLQDDSDTQVPIDTASARR